MRKFTVVGTVEGIAFAAHVEAEDSDDAAVKGVETQLNENEKPLAHRWYNQDGSVLDGTAVLAVLEEFSNVVGGEADTNKKGRTV